MRLLDVRVQAGAGHSALIGRIAAEGAARPLELFFRVPSRFASMLTDRADAFLPALLVPALLRREPLQLDPPVSGRLLRAHPRVQDLLTTWYPRLRHVPVTATAAPVEAATPAPADPRVVAAFFTGGIDSCFTLIKNRVHASAIVEPITHLIFVKGFDGRLADAEPLAESERHLSRIAARHGCELVPVETNLRDELDGAWQELHHGSALAAVALALSGGVRMAYIGGSYAYSELARANGSHPLLDEAWSTDQLSLIHDGCEITRVGKLAAIAEIEPMLLDELRICWFGSKGGPRNCGVCGKCVRTAVILRAIGKLGIAKSLPAKLPADFLDYMGDSFLNLFDDLIKHARMNGERDFARRLDRRHRQLRRRNALRELVPTLPFGTQARALRASVLRRWGPRWEPA
jgi:hypothetical protein